MLQIQISAGWPDVDVLALLGDAPPTLADVLQFASRANFAEAADTLNRIAVPTPHLCHLQTLHGRYPIDLGITRSATSFGLVKTRHHATQPATLEWAIAALANPAKRLAAERLLAAFGFLQTAGGVQHIRDATADRPCLWPKAQRARGALCLWLIVAARRGDLPPGELHLVAPP